MRLQVIGGGKMGEALIGGLVETGWAEPSELLVVEAVESRRAYLAERHPGLALADRPTSGIDALLAVKPVDVPAATAALREAGIPRMLSIAAGITIDWLERALGPDVRVLRAMPNTPALVGAGASALAGGDTATPEDIEWGRSILEEVGTVAVLPEDDLDGVTGLSGSGPAYVFLVAEAMMAAGESVGLDGEVAAALTTQTLLGAAQLLSESGEDAAQLRKNVTSPGGTTAEGIRVLEDAGLRQAFVDAVTAATERSRELEAH